MEYDKWTRKLIKIVEEWGFTKGPNISGSHTKWTYKGPKADREFSIVIPRKNKSGIRAKTIGRIKTNMRTAGVNEAELEAFNKIALGLMQAQPDDDYDDLEEKLAAAIAAKRILIAAEIALEIGKRAGASGETSYKSRAIEDSKQKFNVAFARESHRREIDQLILNHLRIMMREYFGTGEDFSVTRNGSFYADEMSELPHELCAHYGIQFSQCEVAEDSAEISGKFYGDADGNFVNEHGVVQFRLSLSLNDDDSYSCTDNPNDFYSLTSLTTGNLSVDQLKSLHKAIEAVAVMTALKPYYQTKK